MTLAISVLAWIGLVMAGLAAVILAALVWPVHVGIEADERGASGSVRWLGWRYGHDRRSRTWDLRFAGIRVIRRAITGDEDVQTEENASKRTAKKKGRPLSTIGVVRLVRAARRELERLVPRIHIERLRTAVVVATPDPATTGQLFGYGTAMAAAIRGRWPAARLDIGVDFSGMTPRGSIDAVVGTRPIWWAISAARLGWLYMRERRRSRPRARDARRR